MRFLFLRFLGGALPALGLLGCFGTDSGNPSPAGLQGNEAAVFKLQSPLPISTNVTACVRGQSLFAISAWTLGPDFFKSADEGATWNITKLPIPDGGVHEVAAMACPTSDSLFAVGNTSDGAIWKSINGGVTWTRSQDLFSGQPSGGKYFTAVHFLDSRRGWVLSGKRTILKTKDGGENWVTVDGGSNYLFGLTFTDSAVGYAVGETGSILKTTDGGDSWVVRPSGTTNFLVKVDFPVRDTGYAVGHYGDVVRTTNAGASWVTVMKGDTLQLNDVHFYDGKHGIISGSYRPKTNPIGWRNKVPRSAYWTTSNAGVTWTRTFLPGPGTLTQIKFATASKGYMFGADGEILKTTNGGQSWEDHFSGPSSGHGNFSFPTATVGYKTGIVGGILKTVDGMTWKGVYIGPNFWLQALSFVDTSLGYVVGQMGTILKTTNGGADWKTVAGLEVDENWDNATLNSIATPDPTLACAVGDGGRILLTGDAGNNWVQVPSGTTEVLTSVTFFSESRGSAVGGNGVILTTFDGGSSWGTRNHSAGNVTFYFVTRASPLVGYAGGENGVLLKTVDGGANWKRVQTGSTVTLTDASFANENEGWVVEEGTEFPQDMTSGGILATRDGGKTWKRLTGSIPVSGAYNVHFLGNGRGYLGTGTRIFEVSSTP